MSDIPEDVMDRARELVDKELSPIDMGTGRFLIEMMCDKDEVATAIARALMEERAAERERAKAHWLQWHQKRMGISRAFWLSASKAALDGDLRQLRNRVDLAEAEPVQLVLSEASHEA